jgi:hypothetical protein
MSSFLSKLFGRPPPLARPGPVPKSAARLADEQNILAARRKILANMARIEQHPAGKQTVVAQIGEDADRASRIVRSILLGEDRQ